jgi:hypothetical protein
MRVVSLLIQQQLHNTLTIKADYISRKNPIALA